MKKAPAQTPGEVKKESFSESHLLHEIFSQNPHPMWVADRHGTLIKINQACCQLFHVEEDEVINKYNVLQDNIIRQKGLLQDIESVFHEGKSISFQTEYDTSKLDILQLTNTRKLTVQVNASALTDATGQVANVIFVHRDITHKVQLEKNLQLFRHMVESASDAIFWLDRSGRLVYVNKQACSSLGYSKSELLELYLWDIDPDYPPERWQETWQLTVTSGSRTLETFHRRKNGEIFPVEVTAHHLAEEDDQYHIAFVRDISSRKATEKQLLENEAKLKDAQKMAQLGYWSWNVKTGEVEWSPQVYNIFRLDPATFTPQIDSIMALSPWPGERQRHQEIIEKAVRKREQGKFEQRFLRPDGSTGYYFSTFRGVFNEQGELEFMQGTVQDITERKLVEEQLRSSEQKYRSLIDNIGIGIVQISQDMKVLSVNKFIEEVFPESDFSQQPLCYQSLNIPPQTSPCSYCAAVKTLADGKVHETITETSTSSGIRNFRIITSPIKDKAGEVTSVIEMAEDITDKVNLDKQREELEKQLHQSQKMEAVGTLAGGVAHDFNNMLGVIIGYTELLKKKLPADTPLLRYTTEIENAALRSRDTTRQLLGFSRRQAIAPRRINLAKQIEQLQMTLARLIGEEIDLRVTSPPDLWDISFDPSQIDQLLINLAVNARDAMPRGGKLTIESSNTLLDQTFCRHHFDSAPGDYVMLQVSDNGIGMDKETLEHAFDPFFTTKKIGKGTGLGLATVYGIVKQNNGYITIYSEPDNGTTVKIYIPRLKSSEEEAHETIVEEVLSPSTGTILLVEDDKMVRGMAEKMLEDLGYKVLVAENPEHAINIFQTEEEQIDLLLTDVIMPMMNGAELRDRIKVIQPDIKILFMSGYTSTIISRHGVLEGEVNFIQKPFSRNEIAKKIQEVLSSP